MVDGAGMLLAAGWFSLRGVINPSCRAACMRPALNAAHSHQLACGWMPGTAATMLLNETRWSKTA
jgi:hypothetical protein